jgi:hypothetical protein
MRKREHIHGGIIANEIRFKFFVQCQICGHWRFKRKNELFWKSTVKLQNYMVDYDRIIRFDSM